MGNNKYKVLVIEDDKNIQSFVETVLQTNGYQILQAETCSQGIMMVSSYLPDLILLDLGLPDRDGGEVIRHVRAGSATPIIVLSSRWAVEEKIMALDSGANDYITKPFSTDEMLARIRVALRSSRPGVTPSNHFSNGDLDIDYDARQVRVGRKIVHMTQTEYNILAFISQYQGKMLTDSSIIRHIWGKQDSGSVKKLQVNMANIRRKLGCQPGETRYILNELGVGYRMIMEEQEEQD